MERDELLEQCYKRYNQFVNWTFRYVRGNAGAILSGAALHEHQRVINAFNDETNKDLIKAVKQVNDWMDFIRTIAKSYKTKQEFREWVIREQYRLLEYGTNHDRAEKLKEILEGPEIELK
jgi:hypothetical protein